MHQPVTADEVQRWAWERQPHEREAVPEPGEEVLFRASEWGPEQPATVLSVQDMTAPNDGWGGTLEPDVHVWDPQTLELRGDPWPWVTLRLADGRDVTSKEARVRGALGWLRRGSRWSTTPVSEG